MGESLTKRGLGRKRLANATNEDIKAYAYKLGYAFTDEDCDLLRDDPMGAIMGTAETETLASALKDFICAYEV